jgi:hypothetical protein
MSSDSGIQVVRDDGSRQQPYEAPILVDRHSHEAPIPALQNSFEKEPQIGVRSGYRILGQPILGMRRKIFWLVLAIVVVVIVVAVGGGVGGSLANRKTNTSPSEQLVTQRLVHYSVFT